MNISEFAVLPLKERAEKLWNEGKYLESVTYYGHQINLYTLDSFFVEVWYASITQSIAKIEPVYPDGLKKYLGAINIDDIP